MKTKSAFLTLSFAYILLAFATLMAMKPLNDQATTIPEDAIGVLTSSGGTQIYTNHLVTTLLSGEDILFFQIQPVNGNYYLLRKGRSHGWSVTEAFPLSISNGFFKYPNAIKIYKCRTQDANGETIDDYCKINNDEASCSCTTTSTTCESMMTANPVPVSAVVLSN